MAKDEAYYKAEKKIEKARRTGAKELSLSNMGLTEVPESIGELTQLQSLDLSNNKLTTLPESLGQLTQLHRLDLYANQLITLSDSLGNLQALNELWIGNGTDGGNPITEVPNFARGLKNLEILDVSQSQVNCIPEWISELHLLRSLYLNPSKVSDLPNSLVQLDKLKTLDLQGSPLNPELAEAYKQGIDAVKAYLRAKADAQITLNEAKLILVGEGEVGKSCLMDALQGLPWQEHDSTHGIEIRQVEAKDPASGKTITLNGWDFGGQRVYRPTHQLFFSSPAVYLVVWKPREGPQQGFVKEWIKLIKHREPEAKVLVVATHGGPGNRQPDIDRQELQDLFGKETVLGFHFVDSKPDKKTGKRKGIEELKEAIAQVAACLPEVGRSVPKRWQEAREDLKASGRAYLPLPEVLDICEKRGMDKDEANLFVAISHRLGHLIHYAHDPALRDIVVLKPDWLATAISFVLDDETTRSASGMVHKSRLCQLWDDPDREETNRYPADLHPIFLRLMERFDLSYRVAEPGPNSENDPASLIAQLVPDNRPEQNLAAAWPTAPANGDIQQMQICRITDDKGRSATAEGLFYQLIVRLHKYSLGRADHRHSVHWQRGLVLDYDYNGRALLEHFGDDVRITVRAPYPERFLAMLTEEVRYLVGSFWEGLRCEVTVPCLNPNPCIGLLEVRKLIESKQKNRHEYPCPVCNEWQDIDSLLRNAPAAAQPIVLETLLAEFAAIRGKLDEVNINTRRILSQVDETYVNLLQVLTDEAKEGPRLFSLAPVDRSNFNPKSWVKTKFRITLWCEHSRLPLPVLDALHKKESGRGVYEVEVTRDWFKKAAPYVKFVTGTLSLVLPVAASGLKLNMDDAPYKAIEEQLDFGKNVIEASLDGTEKFHDWAGGDPSLKLEHGEAIRAHGGMLREIQTLLKSKDPSFGGLIRVMNKRQEFVWVYEAFEGEY